MTVWRDFLINDFYFPVEDYAKLRTFYGNFERKDHGSVVLKRTSEEKASMENH